MIERGVIKRGKSELLEREGTIGNESVFQTGSKNIPFCGGRDGTRCGAVSAAPFSPLVDSTSTKFLSFVSLPSRVTLFLVLESTWGGDVSRICTRFDLPK